MLLSTTVPTALLSTAPAEPAESLCLRVLPAVPRVADRVLKGGDVLMMRPLIITGRVFYTTESLSSEYRTNSYFINSMASINY